MDPLDYLYGLELHGIKLGLQNITTLLSAAGNPQNTYPTVHIAGTNGKGSTAAFLDHILRQAHYRIARFTSPHLITINERFTINGTPITDAQLKTLIQSFKQYAEQADITPTFFELNTAIAFQHFQDQNADIALIEVGLGGRFDSTNVINPRLSIITNIDLEHTEFLGDTHAKIAFEKAGIIKPDTPLILGKLNQEAENVILQRAKELQAPTLKLGTDFTCTKNQPDHETTFQSAHWKIDQLQSPLSGQHQAENMSVALAAAEALSTQFKNIQPNIAKRGIANTKWPCRMETVLTQPHVIIDVAHNPAGCQTLVDTLEKDAIIILSIAQRKNIQEMIDILATRSRQFILTQFDNHRAINPNELAPLIPNRTPTTIEPDFNQAIDLGIKKAKESAVPLLITGSLFTAGQARRYLIEHYDAPPIQF